MKKLSDAIHDNYLRQKREEKKRKSDAAAVEKRNKMMKREEEEVEEELKEEKLDMKPFGFRTADASRFFFPHLLSVDLAGLDSVASKSVGQT